jgi:hypothetical protein
MQRSLTPMHRTLFLLTLLAPGLLAAEQPTVTKDNVSTFYMQYARLTEKPRFISAEVIYPCESASPPLQKDGPGRAGPHKGGFIHVYANATAAEAIKAGFKELPEGSVFVKEKLGPKKAVSEIGGMIKRPKGYDPANGDWEYFFHDKSGQFTTGKLTHCSDCHNAALRDRTFSVWRLTKK